MYVLNSRKRIKTKAAEIEHAIRHYIDVNIDEDPELFASFARALEDILTNFKGNWQLIYEELEKLRQKIKNREIKETYGLDRKKQFPFFNIFKAELFDNKELNEDEIALNVNLTQHITELLSTEIQLKGFWNSPQAQSRLIEDLQKLLLSPNFKALPQIFAKRKVVVSRIMERAKYHHSKIVGE